ncbi:hypothetical protein [Nocardioides sp. YIM 152315]|uniref:hypothetical protein n=1 Tax=Nocardioides sp. YIM 152315 TaxID=3031760 RepID=UPI0023DCE231|nr:hypothetical protein [Nocardioides sp. YIM 152315]MDF1605089.1 hypothetical protein [Nocardioides sp. YIM 152315]
MTDRGRAVLVGLVAAVALVGCSGDEDPSLLTDDDLPAIESTTTFGSGQPTATTCSELTTRIPSIGTPDADGPQPLTKSYTLESGDVVTASLFVPAQRYGDADGALAAVEEAVAACVEKGDVTALSDSDGLPEGAVGFSGSTTGEDVAVQALAPTGDDRIVSVTVTHTGGGEPAVEIAEVLSAALANASDIGRDES